MIRKLLLALITVAIFTPAIAQKKPKKDKGDSSKEQKKEKTIEDIAKSCTVIPGLFTLYQDTTSGSVYMEVKSSQLNKEFIHFSQIMDAPVDFYERGSYGYEKIFSIQKYYERMEIRLENTNTYFDPADPLSRAKDANINRPIIYSEKIEAQSADGKRFLIKAEPLFLDEAFAQIKPRPNPMDKNPFSLKMGNLSKDKSKFIQLKSFEKNTDVRVELVYENSSMGNFWQSWEGDLTDPRFINIEVYNTMIEMPNNDFQPRFDDPRVGYFGIQVENMTERSSTPYRDMISRWHLVKKDPNAEMSEPVEPITWWIENTTPEDFREPLRQGILRWNRAFEAAGFKNAVVVNIQPDDADWDADDIRYNVVRWVSLPRSLYGGAFGPSVFNPRTGQMLGADVIMYYGFIRGQGMEEELYTRPSGKDHFNSRKCSYASEMATNFHAGMTMIRAMGHGAAAERELIDQSLMMLALHEVGHTMGLNHNFMASHYLDNDKIHDKDFTSTYGMTGSVMDYSGVNLSPNKESQGLYYEVTPGPYDKWAIEYGYRTFASKKEEEAGLKKILARSTEPQLLFGNDADAMRSPGQGIDPRAQTWDQTSDPIQYAIDRFAMIESSMKTLMDRMVENGESYQHFKNSYNFLFRDWWTGLTTTSRYIGGVYIDRAFAGQEGSTQPYTPVPYEQQKRAMNTLAKHAFGSNAMNTPSDMYKYLQDQRRGFNFWGSTEDPKIHDRILAFQQGVLDYLIHPVTWQRMIDTELYGNTYRLSEMTNDLTQAVFKADINGRVNYQRQNLQTEYVKRLSEAMTSDSYNHVGKATAFNQLKSIEKMLDKASSPDTASKAHKQYLSFLIDESMEMD